MHAVSIVMFALYALAAYKRRVLGKSGSTLLLAGAVRVAMVPVTFNGAH